jgi:hypothetical protein
LAQQRHVRHPIAEFQAIHKLANMSMETMLRACSCIAPPG